MRAMVSEVPCMKGIVAVVVYELLGLSFGLMLVLRSMKSVLVLNKNSV